MLQRSFIAMLWVGLLGGCASSQPASPSSVLEPVEEAAASEEALPVEAGTDVDAEAQTEDSSPKAPVEAELVPPSPEYLALKAQLEALGYQGVGLQYEPSGELDFLSEVFSDPRTTGLRLKRVYTGMELAYDKAHESVTIGGTRDKEKVIRFLLRHSKP